MSASAAARLPLPPGAPRPLRFARIKVTIATAGWLYIGLTLMVGAAAVNTTNNLLYLMTSGLLALMALSGMVAYRALRRLEFSLSLPGEWFAAREVPVGVRVTNGRRRLPTFLLHVERDGREAVLIEIPPGATETAVVPFDFPRRGRAQLGELLVTSPFPFGLFRRGGRVRLDGEVVVYPTPLPVHEDGAGPPQAGDPRLGSRHRGVGGDYLDSRPYLPGDPLSRIDWKTAGRLGKLAVKEFEDEGAPPLLLDLDSVPGPGLEERLGQLTTLVLTAHAEHRSVGLELGEQRLGPGLGAGMRGQQLRALALYRE